MTCGSSRRRRPQGKIGDARINHPAQPNADIQSLQAKGVKVFSIGEDLEERGIKRAACIDGVQLIKRKDVAALFEDFAQVWHW